MRIARPVSDLQRSRDMYVRGMRLAVLGSFDEHCGFDGVMLGAPGAAIHCEFTRRRSHPIIPTPSVEDLVVVYIPDALEWQRSCDDMTRAGFTLVTSYDPCWDLRGQTFSDHDGYRTVLERAQWTPHIEP
jgi:hypothetical protein